MGTPPLLALALLAAALPVCVWAGLSDLQRMKIPNRAVMALAGIFAVVGLALVPLEGWTLADWAWRWAHLALVLVVGLGVYALGGTGAGDVKFAAAAAPFVAASDGGEVAIILAATMLAAFAAHRLARASFGPTLAPTWVSWSTGRRFPMGVALGGTLAIYLALAALG